MTGIAKKVIASAERAELLLENDRIRAVLLPHDGGRLVSLVEVRSGREFIWTNSRTDILIRTHGADYDNLSAGGVEEAFPTGLADRLDGMELPFFGELWPVAWRYEPSGTGDGWRLETDCGVYAARVSKEWTLIGNTLSCAYTLTNLSGLRLPYLFGVHPSLRIQPGDRLELPRAAYTPGAMFPEGLLPPEVFEWPAAGGRDLSVAPGEDACEYTQIYTVAAREGALAIHAVERDVRLLVRYDAAFFTSLSVWMLYGGWRGHRCVMAEFFTGWPLRLSEAARQNGCAYLAPRETVSTVVKYAVCRDTKINNERMLTQ